MYKALFLKNRSISIIIVQLKLIEKLNIKFEPLYPYNLNSRIT